MRVDQPVEQQFRIHVGDHACAFDHRAVLQLDARRAPPLDDHTCHRRIRPEHHPARGTLFRHRLGDRAHAATGVAPLAPLAVHLAEHVMQQDVRGAG